MSFGLSNHGEKLHFDGGYVGKDIEVTLYLDDTDIDNDGDTEGDDLSDDSTLSDVTTEPNISRKTVTVQQSDVEKFSGDFGFTKQVVFDTSNTVGKVDGALLIDKNENKIIGRFEIQDPEPGPFQSIDGLKEYEIEPRLTTN